MAKQCQIVALTNARKPQAQKDLTAIYQRHKVAGLLDGFSRTYEPDVEGAEQLPPETKKVQVMVEKDFEAIKSILTGLWDIVLTQDAGNTLAKADIKVGDKVLVKAVPATHLLFLEKQLEELHVVIGNLPILDPAEDWQYDSSKGFYKTDVAKTRKTKKVTSVIVKYDATDKHPAQTELVNEDKQVGTFNLVKFSGGIPVDKKQSLIAKVIELQNAVKMAREEANSTVVPDQSIGKELLGYVFG